MVEDEDDGRFACESVEFPVEEEDVVDNVMEVVFLLVRLM